MYYECRKCGRKLEELKRLGKVKFCGDFYKCTDCNNDITKDLDSWYKEVMDFGKEIWEAGASTSFDDAEMEF